MAKKQKIYVLDTSVLLHDHHSLVNFKKSDVAIPITVLEELDKFKVGNDIKNFAAREVIRSIDKIAGTGNLQSWVKLGGSDLGRFKIILDSSPKEYNAEYVFSVGKNDHKIINSALVLKETEPTKDVILVTKDINLRIKAKALGLHAEDYETGKVDSDILDETAYSHIENLDSEIIRMEKLLR